MPFVIYGDGFNNKDDMKFKDLRHGVSNKIYGKLQHKGRLGELLLGDLNERKASKISENAKRIHRVLNCTTCNIWCNRDVSAAKECFIIFTSIWSGNGHPNVFQRQHATSNVVASTHFGKLTA
ncbi:hypothetical protein BD408DRAFT_435123 [Parasitella parasitica]|nr:hypothetical protein BD408DRAFT_435123 [Parasitella parasitica]